LNQGSGGDLAGAGAVSREQINPKQALGASTAIAIIVGIVIGAGIFKTPSMVAGLTGDAGWMMMAWVLGAVISVAGAPLLCGALHPLCPRRGRLSFSRSCLRQAFIVFVRMGQSDGDQYRIDCPAGFCFC